MNWWVQRAHRKTEGFTVIELLIVIIVIGILSVIVAFGYGAVQNNAHDASVQSDLQKIDDAFKQYALDTGGLFPTDTTELDSVDLALNGDSYYTGDLANVYVCENATQTEYAVMAKSRSGKRFYIKSEEGIDQYTGGVTWDAATGNWVTTCSAIDASYTPLVGNVSGMNSGTWESWTGVPAS